MNPRHEQARTGQRRMAAARKYWQPHPAPHPEPPTGEIGAQRGLQAPLSGSQAVASTNKPRPDEAPAISTTRVDGPLAPQEVSQ